MSAGSFVTGRWTGFYNYAKRSQKYPMDLILEFKNGILTGEGHDGIGAFVISGNYSITSHECNWQKTYVGRHSVEYRGFGEGKGIWGIWTLTNGKGGFQIWPLNDGEPPAAMREKEPTKSSKNKKRLAHA